MSISASMVKELRERTGAGMMECKKALVDTDGDMDSAVELLRKSGQAKADKKAGRVADYFEFAELMCRDALERDESCGAHFRVEHQTADGEAVRDDDNNCHVSVWQASEGNPPTLHKEALEFESVQLTERNYK